MTFDFADVIPFHDSLHEISAQEFPKDDSWTSDYHPGILFIFWPIIANKSRKQCWSKSHVIHNRFLTNSDELLHVLLDEVIHHGVLAVDEQGERLDPPLG